MIDEIKRRLMQAKADEHTARERYSEYYYIHDVGYLLGVMRN